MQGIRVYTVSEVNRYIGALLESDDILSGIWVRGEISNFNHHTSGHMYFSLKDEIGRLKCVMFKTWNSRLSCKLEDGMSVFAYGSVRVYDRNGDYQLYVEEIEPAGLGSLYLAFLQLKEKLEREGLLAPGRKRPLPAFPSVVGVVTSPTGAAIRDIVTVLRRRWPGVTVILSPALVQGDGAPESIVNAIEAINRYADEYHGVDVLIVGRGGGAIEELWAFNDERVARAIANSKIPVISAVGHETDFTIADFVADRRAPTPSAAAEMAVPDVIELARRLDVSAARMRGAVEERLRAHRQAVDEELRAIMASVDYSIRLRREKLAALAGRLHALSPLATLARGYAICRALPGRMVVRAAREVAVGSDVEVILADGRIECGVKFVEGANENGGGDKKAGAKFKQAKL